MNNFLQTPIEFLKGVGPQKAELLHKELGIATFQDLIYHFPFRHIDRTKFHQIQGLNDFENSIQLKGKIENIHESGSGRHKKLIAHLNDGSGSISLIWFKGISWIKKSLLLNTEYLVYGKAKLYSNQLSIAHPEMTVFNPNESLNKFQPVYSSTEKLNTKGLHSKGIEKLVRQLLPDALKSMEDPLPKWIKNEMGLIDFKIAMEKIHFPSTTSEFHLASMRLKFNEIFFIQLEQLYEKQRQSLEINGHSFPHSGSLLNTFYKEHLPFELTNAQKKVLREIHKDFGSGKQMNRLIQGDVGSGKTLVALMAMLIAIGNGYQASLMAPTEILANQHFESLSEFLEEMDIRIELLTGSTKKSKRKLLLEDLADGKISIIIGTHALIEDAVVYKNLGLVVIDEQHRFGVVQRARMWRKNSTPPHIMVMTATPIPRTLAMTLYGDLDVSTIDELPPGRKPVKTVHSDESKRLAMFGFLKKEIDAGRQAYIVYPLIKESETLDFNNLMDGFESVSRYFPKPQYQISIVHGQMKAQDKEFEMQRFSKGETQILVATTVIEVGVNVPNASVMVIEGADRFGLSQLHQLRGRVGRGVHQSYCILMTEGKLSFEAQKRMNTMVRTNDGFEVAEVDLELRGPGDIQGTQQSGTMNFKLIELTKDGLLIQRTRKLVLKLLEIDAHLEHPNHIAIQEKLQETLRSKKNWSKIS